MRADLERKNAAMKGRNELGMYHSQEMCSRRKADVGDVLWAVHVGEVAGTARCN